QSCGFIGGDRLSRHAARSTSSRPHIRPYREWLARREKPEAASVLASDACWQNGTTKGAMARRVQSPARGSFDSDQIRRHDRSRGSDAGTNSCRAGGGENETPCQRRRDSNYGRVRSETAI